MNIDFHGLRRRCAAMVATLPVPEPFDARELCRLVAEGRGRPIHLQPMTNDAGAVGLWVATESADLIFYEEATTTPHQEHIILHELGHLLFNHFPGGLTETDHMQLLFPDLDPEMVRRVMGRTTYSDVEEQEAELFASLVRRQRKRATGLRRDASMYDERVKEAFGWSDTLHG